MTLFKTHQCSVGGVDIHIHVLVKFHPDKDRWTSRCYAVNSIYLFILKEIIIRLYTLFNLLLLHISFIFIIIFYIIILLYIIFLYIYLISTFATVTVAIVSFIL